MDVQLLLTLVWLMLLDGYVPIPDLVRRPLRFRPSLKGWYSQGAVEEGECSVLTINLIDNN